MLLLNAGDLQVIRLEVHGGIYRTKLCFDVPREFSECAANCLM